MPSTKALVEAARAAVRGRAGRFIGRGVRLRLVAGGELVLGDRVRIGPHSEITVDNARLEIGERTRIGARCRIAVTEGVSIGDRCEISWDCQIMDTDHHQITETDGRVTPQKKAVVIGDHVLIGTQVIVLKGVTIGDGAVIAAGSVVARDVPPSTLLAGAPARALRQIADWR